MLRSLRKKFGMVLFVVLSLTACATIQVNSVWKDPSYQLRPAKIMVIGVEKSLLKRRLFEDEFAMQIKAHGTGAIASYTVVPDSKQDDQDVIAAKVKELGADAVLITRLVSKKIVKTYVPGIPYFPPPFYETWPAYYGYGYRYIYSPGYITEDEYAVIETNLYETRNDKLVWVALSETVMSDSHHELIRSYIGIMVKMMSEHGLLSSREPISK